MKERIEYAWKHLRTVCRHKLVVYQECKACGITWRGIVHDLSKFSPTEFLPSARYFQGDKSPIEAQKAAEGYSAAWLHHKAHNKHHWEYWTDFGENGEVIANKIPSVYVIEMVCDWIGAGKVYGGEGWTEADPLDYFLDVIDGRYFHLETEGLILDLLELIQSKGLDEFHRVCRRRYPLFTDYEGLYIP